MFATIYNKIAKVTPSNAVVLFEKATAISWQCILAKELQLQVGFSIATLTESFL